MTLKSVRDPGSFHIVAPLYMGLLSQGHFMSQNGYFIQISIQRKDKMGGKNMSFHFKETS